MPNGLCHPRGPRGGMQSWTGRGEGLVRPPGFKAEQGEGVRSPGPGQPLAQSGEGSAVVSGTAEAR